MPSDVRESITSRLSRWLIEPSSRVTVSAKRRRARLLAGLLLFTLVMVTLSLFERRIVASIAAVALVALAYALSRTRHYQWGAILAVVGLMIPSFAVIFDLPPESLGDTAAVALPLSWLLLGVILASMWANTGATALLTGITAALLAGLTLILPGIDTLAVAQNAVLFSVSGGILAIAAALRERDIREIEAQTAELESQKQEVAASAARYRELVENISDIIYRVNTRGKFVYVSSSAARLTGYSTRQLLTMHFTELIAPSHRQALLEFYSDQLSTREPEALISFPLVRPDGETRWVEQKTTILLGEDDDILGFQGVVRDITERVMSETLLRQRDALLEAVAFSSEQLVAHPDWRNAIMAVLRRLGEGAEASRLRIFQRHPDSPDEMAIVSQRYEWVAKGIQSEIDNPELQGFPMGEVFPQWVDCISQRRNVYTFAHELPEESIARAVIDRQGIRSLLIMPIWANSTWWGVISFEECAGQRMWAQTEIDVLQSAVNNLGAMIERQERETTLQETLNLLNEAQSIGQMGNWEWDLRTGALYWSDEIYRIAGLEPGSVTLTREMWQSLIHPSDRERAQRAIEQALAGQPYSSEMRIIPPDGTIRYVQNRGQVIFNEDGQAILMKGITLDITERKLIERRIQTQNESLVKANRELAVARKQAEAASTLKSQFLATMSHELRTPLNAVIGYTQLQLAGMVGDLTDEQYSFQERVLANAQHLLQLINEVLDLSRIEAGRLELAEKPFNLPELMQEIVLQNYVLAQAKGLEFSQTIDDRLPQIVIGDRGRIKQVVINLVSNAIKFTDHGSVTIEATLHNEASWRITVTDTGAGISPTMQEIIFDEFRQAENGLERGGTGLGLAIVRKLVLMMGGKVCVSSEIGQGSVFTVTLPLITESRHTPEVLEA